jgi:hypothetical protein
LSLCTSCITLYWYRMCTEIYRRKLSKHFNISSCKVLILVKRLKVAQKLLKNEKVASSCSNWKKLLQTKKVAQKLPSTIGPCLPATRYPYPLPGTRYPLPIPGTHTRYPYPRFPPCRFIVYLPLNAAIRIKIKPFDSELEIVLITDVNCITNSILAIIWPLSLKAKRNCIVDKSLKIIKLITN